MRYGTDATGENPVTVGTDGESANFSSSYLKFPAAEPLIGS
jgi:hypothetical protein